MTKADASWCQDFLDSHNKYRSLHQAAPLQYNDKLNKLAQAWADKIAAQDTFKHSDCKFEQTRVGENIAMKMSSQTTDFAGHEFVDQWYSEVERYDFNKNSGPSTGHFTQVVWKGSQELGVGRAVTKSGKVMVVANYLPAGNMMGDNPQNVFPTKDGSFKLPEKEEMKKPKPALRNNNDDVIGGGVTPRGLLIGQGDHATPSGGEVKNYKSLRKETLTRRTADGKIETVVREIYTFPDGSTQTKEKREVKTDPEPLTKKLDRIKVAEKLDSTSPDEGTFVEEDDTSDDMKKFRQDTLTAHNNKRKLHGSQPMKKNAMLDRTAQQWADHLAKSGEFAHSKNEYQGHRLGENIANKWSSHGADYTGQDVTDQWYSEEPQYEYSGESKTLKAGHFTQVVWAGSRELGVGKAKTSGGKCIVVCNYYPAGNIIGRFKENVAEPKK